MSGGPVGVWTWAGVLAATWAVSGCDAILGLGEPPPGGEGGASSSASTGNPSTTTVGSSSGDATTTSAGGGDGGGGGSSSSSTASAGGGGTGGGPGDAPCGTCEENPTCECAQGGERCAVRTWTLPNTDGSAAESFDIINRYGRGFAVTDEFIVFTRNVDNGGSSRHMATVVSRANGETGGVDLMLGESRGIGSAAASGSGRVVVAELGSSAGPLYEVELGEEPALQVEIPALTFDGGNRVGPLSWAGEGERFVYAHREAGNLFGFELDGGLPPCPVADTPDRYSAPADIHLAGGEIAVLRYLSPYVERAEELGCNADPMVNDAPNDEFTLGRGIAVDGGITFLQGLLGGSSQTFRADGAGNPIQTYPSAAIAAGDGSVYVGHPAGGIYRCPASLDVRDINGCDLLVEVGRAGRAALFEATSYGLIAIGYGGPDEDVSFGETHVTCVDTRR